MFDGKNKRQQKKSTSSLLTTGFLCVVCVQKNTFFYENICSHHTNTSLYLMIYLSLIFISRILSYFNISNYWVLFLYLYMYI